MKGHNYYLTHYPMSNFLVGKQSQVTKRVVNKQTTLLFSNGHKSLKVLQLPQKKCHIDFLKTIWKIVKFKILLIQNCIMLCIQKKNSYENNLQNDVSNFQNFEIN